MTKILTEEINHCGECRYADVEIGTGWWFCHKVPKKKIKDIWGEIPKWCPLEEKKGIKEVENGNNQK